MVTPKHEPLEFSAGDALSFNKCFSDFLPSAGWTLNYEIRQGSGGDAIQFAATPDSTNTFFQVNVASAVTALWNPGASVLVGYVLNTLATSPDYRKREQIYYNNFTLYPNMGTGTDDQPTTTHAQRMLVYLEQQLELSAQHLLHATTVEQTELIRVKRLDLMQQQKEYSEKRRNEIALENVRNGRPSGQRILPQMRIVAGQPGIGSLYWPAPPQ